MPHFRTDGAVDHKGGDLFDPVTKADRDAETAIREGLAQAYPSHGILGEEFGATATDAEYCWIIDPIDGTRAFILGLPLWGTLIGLTRAGSPLLGLMDQPFTRERFWSGETKSFFGHDGVDENHAYASLRRAWPGAACHHEHGLLHEEENRRFGALSSAVRLRRFGGDCYNYCLLAMGHIDLVVEAGLKPFDILPLIPIVERAGGIVTSWEGGDPREGGRIVAAGDRRAHAAAVKMLTG